MPTSTDLIILTKGQCVRAHPVCMRTHPELRFSDKRNDLKCVIVRRLSILSSHVRTLLRKILYSTIFLGCEIVSQVKNVLSEPYQKVSQIFERNGPQEITRENNFCCTDIYIHSGERVLLGLF